MRYPFMVWLWHLGQYTAHDVITPKPSIRPCHPALSPGSSNAGEHSSQNVNHIQQNKKTLNLHELHMEVGTCKGSPTRHALRQHAVNGRLRSTAANYVEDCMTREDCRHSMQKTAQHGAVESRACRGTSREQSRPGPPAHVPGHTQTHQAHGAMSRSRTNICSHTMRVVDCKAQELGKGAQGANEAMFVFN